MTTGRWHRLRELFDRAIRLPRSERAAFLAGGEVDDPDLREELAALLREHTTTEPDADPAGKAGDWEARPERVGAYDIVRELGRGGMGVVYEARRREEGGRRVALKIVRSGLDSYGAVERFQRERRILAQLEHPQITRLYGAGVTERGQPYFVMEYVEGLPWQEAVAALALGARVALLIQVCRAVEYAHQRLILHRDLKPSNILVTPGGEIKLLDFGAAGLLDADPEWTLGAHRPFTPKYASPELRGGQPVAVAADVFSLGVMLGELMPAGREPDLEAIASRATREEPWMRYPSVAAFQADLERYLAHEPVEARQGRLAYRARKFLRRRRGAVMAAGVALVAGGLGVAALMRESARADASLNSLRAVSREFMLAATETFGRDAAAAERYQRLLVRSAPYLREVFLSRYSPELLAAFDDVCGVAEAARSGRALDRTCGEVLAEALRRTSQAGSHDEGWFALAVSDVFGRLRRDEEAVRWTEKALELTPPSLERVQRRMDLANIEFRRGKWQGYLQRVEEAVQEWVALPGARQPEASLLLRLVYLLTLADADEHAVFLLEEMRKRDERSPYGRAERIDLFDQLARHAFWQKQWQRAEAYSRRTIDLLGEPPMQVAALAQMANAWHRHADVLRDAGRGQEAIAAYRRALLYAERTRAADVNSLEAPLSIDVARLKLAEGLYSFQHFAEALKELEPVVTRRYAVWRARPKEGFAARDAAYALALQMRCRAELGELTGAVTAGSRALEATAGFDEPRHVKHAREIHEYLAEVQTRLGQPESAAWHRQEAAARAQFSQETVQQRRRQDLAAALEPLRPVLASLAQR